MHSYRLVWLAVLSIFFGTPSFIVTSRVRAQQPQQRLVEEVDIQGNRRLRKDDILYWVQTRPGDPYNADQVARDLQTLNGLGFFEKTETKVNLEDAPRGGIRLTFFLKGIPIIPVIQL